MKKFYFLCASAALMAFSSCTKDGYQEFNSTVPAPAISIITSLNTGDVSVIPGVYGFRLTTKNYESTAYVISPDLIADNTSLSFTSNSQDYKTSGNDVFMSNVTGTVGNTNMELNNANFLALNPIEEPTYKYGYYYDLTNIGNTYTFKLNYQFPWIAIAKYNIGNSYRVNTFPETTFFRGTTTTQYSANPNGYTNDDITYRFTIMQDKETKKFSANMILYNAKFAAEMPVSLVAVLVEGLDVDFSADGVTISGTDIIPSYYKEAGFDPLPMYIFKSVVFKTTNSDYTSGMIDYEVGTDYKGHFEGSYVNSYYHP